MIRARLATLATLALACTLLGSCAKFEFYWVHRNEPVPEEAVKTLKPGESELQQCLDALGAPQRVWESPQGVVLTYGWLDQFYSRFEIVLYGTDSSIDGRTLFSFNNTNLGYDGYALVFDNDLTLRQVRYGLISDITRDLPRRPIFIE